ncbi:MAG: chemotaxis protein CheD [bacterium]
MGESEQLVGIAEVKAGRAPETLVVYGLGSCVGVALYDRESRNGGLAHVMLPSSAQAAKVVQIGKYADTAINFLVGELGRMGSPPGRLAAKLVGGANMFKTLVSHPVSIGSRNGIAARESLWKYSIPIVGEDLGGEAGRTIQFSLADGRIRVKKMNQPEFWL